MTDNGKELYCVNSEICTMSCSPSNRECEGISNKNFVKLKRELAALNAAASIEQEQTGECELPMCLHRKCECGHVECSHADVQPNCADCDCNMFMSAPAEYIEQGPVAQELMWLWTHCRAIGMLDKSTSGKLEHDIALFTIRLKERAEAVESIEQEPEIFDIPNFLRRGMINE